MNIIKMEAEKTGYICLKNHKIDWDCKKEEGNIFSKFQKEHITQNGNKYEIFDYFLKASISNGKWSLTNISNGKFSFLKSSVSYFDNPIKNRSVNIPGGGFSGLVAKDEPYENYDLIWCSYNEYTFTDSSNKSKIIPFESPEQAILFFKHLSCFQNWHNFGIPFLIK